MIEYFKKFVPNVFLKKKIEFPKTNPKTRNKKYFRFIFIILLKLNLLKSDTEKKKGSEIETSNIEYLTASEAPNKKAATKK